MAVAHGGPVRGRACPWGRPARPPTPPSGSASPAARRQRPAPAGPRWPTRRSRPARPRPRLGWSAQACSPRRPWSGTACPWRSPSLWCSWRITRDLPDGRAQVGDRHLKIYEPRDNLGREDAPDVGRQVVGGGVGDVVEEVRADQRPERRLAQRRGRAGEVDGADRARLFAQSRPSNSARVRGAPPTSRGRAGHRRPAGTPRPGRSGTASPSRDGSGSAVEEQDRPPVRPAPLADVQPQAAAAPHRVNRRRTRRRPGGRAHWLLPSGAPIPAVEPTGGGRRHSRAPSPVVAGPGWQLIGRTGADL